MLPIPSFLRSVFTLDTLDSRFTTNRLQASSQRPGNGRSSPERQPTKRLTDSPPRWKTPEFFVYYGVFLVAIPLMFKTTYDLSKSSHPNYKKFEHLLSDGWIPGRKVDNSDAQYASIRNNIPILAGVTFLHFVLRRGFDMLVAKGRTHAEKSSERLTKRVIFDIVFALIFLSVLHGFSVLKILVILTLNYWLSSYFGDSLGGPIATWGFNIGILFLNEMCKGYRFSVIFPNLLAGEGGGIGALLDRMGGIMPRWEIHFNITMLRLVSYNLDYYWSLKESEGAALEVGDFELGLLEDGADVQLKKKQQDGVVLSERERVDTPCGREDYNFFTYIAYALYSPLYLAGPIITYNDYVAQLRNPIPSVSYKRTFKYFVRLVISILVMEFVLHYLYVVAISKTAHTKNSWAGDSPFQLSMVGYFNLHIIWLKLLIPWRIFRFWALLDGVDPPENMVRCMSNNYSAFGFWRGWHRSFNRWIIRYIYIPMSGGKRPILNALCVFTFVALWHDISLQLLYWGWLITLFMLPEVFARVVFPAKKFTAYPNIYRHLCAMGAVVNIMMMMAANLVGFAIGLDGLKDLVRGILNSYGGMAYLAAACGALFVGAQMMFEIRQEELRAGINLKC